MTMSPHSPNAHIDEEHIWCQVFESAQRFSTPRPTLFLDRDGVIVEEVHYLHKISDVALIEGASEVIAMANRLSIPVVIVTNQSGIARDYFGWSEFDAVQNHMLDLLRQKNGAFVDAVYACPHHKVGKEPYCQPDHPARKPNPGMILRALEAINIDPTRSWIVGDKAGDLKAGLRAGLAGGLQVATGHGLDDGERANAIALAKDDFKVMLGDSIAAALMIDILKP